MIFDRPNAQLPQFVPVPYPIMHHSEQKCAHSGGLLVWRVFCRPQSAVQWFSQWLHISVLNGGLWDTGQVHCGICGIGLYWCHFNPLCAELFGNWTSIHFSERTSYCKILSNLKAAKFGFRLFQSLWNLTGSSTDALLRCLSNFRVIRWL